MARTLIFLSIRDKELHLRYTLLNRKLSARFCSAAPVPKMLTHGVFFLPRALTFCAYIAYCLLCIEILFCGNNVVTISFAIIGRSLPLLTIISDNVNVCLSIYEVCAYIFDLTPAEESSGRLNRRVLGQTAISRSCFKI